MNRLYLYMIAALLLVACNKEVGTPSTEAVALSFDVKEVVAPSRATINIDNSTLRTTGFGVFAYETGPFPFDPATSTSNFMYNQRVHDETNTGRFSYSPEKFWPNMEGTKITFFAYAPHGAATVTLPSYPATGTPTLTVSIPPNAIDQIDLLAATPLTDLTKQTETVRFHFSHLLTRIDFAAILDDDLFHPSLSVKIDSITITNLYKNGNHPISGIATEQWALLSTPATFFVQRSDGGLENIPIDKNLQQITSDKGALLVLPQTITDQVKIGVTYSTFINEGADKVLTNAYEIPLHTTTPLFRKGQHLIYVLTLSATGVSVYTYGLPESP